MKRPAAGGDGATLAPRGSRSVAGALALASCSSRPEPVATLLVDHFEDATVANAVVAKEGPPRIEWHFDGHSKGIAAKEGSPIGGWKDVRGLAIRDRYR